jgi:anti-anti-sigma factor
LRLENRPVRIDLSELEFMDSSGIHLLMDELNEASGDGWHLEIDPRLSPRVDRLFKLAGLDRVLLGHLNGRQ